MQVRRRDFLKLAATLPLPIWLPTVPAAQDGTAPRDLLVFLFLRGGLDALHFLVPHTEARYYDLRGTLAVPAPDSGETGAAIDLDGRFGLHPQLAPLVALYQANELALVTAAGSPDPSHSHFESRDYAEFATPGDKTTRSGWIGRWLEQVPATTQGLFRAVGIGQVRQKSLYGNVPAVTVDSTDGFGLISTRYPTLSPYRSALESLYAGDSGLHDAAADAFAAESAFVQADPGRFEPENGADYPASELGDALLEAGRIIKSGLGTEAICVDGMGWDTHTRQKSTLDERFDDLARSLVAFRTDLGERMASVCLVVMSEFGRRVQANASAGTDHGHGGLMLLLGGAVNGGQVYGEWPGLGESDLYGPGDLEVTTDFRTVLSEVAEKQLGGPDLDTLFPGFTQAPFLGLCNAA